MTGQESAEKTVTNGLINKQLEHSLVLIRASCG